MLPPRAVDGAIALQKATTEHTLGVRGCKRQMFGVSLAAVSEGEQPDNSDISVFRAAYRERREIGNGVSLHFPPVSNPLTSADFSRLGEQRPESPVAAFSLW